MKTGRNIGCGDGDVCNNSKADEAKVTWVTYVWTCPPAGGICH